MINTPQKSQNDKFIIQWERLKYSLHAFPDISTQWNARVSGVEKSKGCKSKWPIITYYTESQATVLSIQRQWRVLLRSPLWKEMTEDTSLTFSFSWAFSLHKTAASAFFLCWGGNDTVPGVPAMASIGDSKAFALCVHERTWRLVQLWQAADFFSPEWWICRE